jgi:hypothetical protein
MLNHRDLTTVAEDLIEMCELWVWDSDEHDYQVCTFAEPNQVVWDRPCKDVWVPKEHMFVQICPNPDPNYFYGLSEVERLIPLQRLRNERMDQVRHLLNLQTKPPKVLSGFSGSNDEVALALDSPNGIVVSEIPTAQGKVIQPTIPEDVYREIREIDTMFEEVSGISGILQGKSEPGVRSNAHAKNLAQFGSSRARKRALVIEDSLEKMGTLYVQAFQRYDDKHSYRGEDGIEFHPWQFTEDYVCKIDAHSSSPIFVEDNRTLALKLFEAKAIDRESLIDITDPPMAGLLKLRLETRILPAEKEQAAQAAAAGAKPGGNVAQIGQKR